MRAHLPGCRMRRAAACVVTLAMLAAAPAFSQEMDVPVSLQVPLFLKVFSYDRQARGADHGSPAFGIAFQSGHAASAAAKDQAARAFAAAAATVDGVPMRLVLIDLDKESLATVLGANHVCVLYVAPLRSVAIAKIAVVSRQAGALVVSGVPEYVNQGVVVGIRLAGERPKLIVNLAAMRATGADFPAELLKLTQVVR
jgi:hypothetical protein